MENQDVFFRNNTGIKSKSAIVDGFVVRISEFDKIRESLSSATPPFNVENTVVIGQRGAGKTTLLHRVKYAVNDEPTLSGKYIPVIFSEEQYNLSDLTNLWEAIAIVIDDEFGGSNLSGKIEKLIDSEEDFESRSLECITDYLKTQQKTALIFLENVNFFLKKLGEAERIRLIQIITSAEIPLRIIGSSTTFNDGSIDFGSSLYDLFVKIRLDGLSQKECELLLITIGKAYGEEEHIRNVIANYPGRVESLRRLTGGVPRTISYLFQIFLDNENGKAIKDLYLLIDNLSILYKSELDQLSTQQQKVVDAIARMWDAISVKDIVKKTRLESKNVSTILAYLEKNQIIEKVPTSTKNFLYRIRERFMNIWYLMRFGRKNDKENVIWLVRFFDAWCDASELTKKAKTYMDNLKDGNYDESAAIDMGNTFLSCENIPAEIKAEILKTGNSVLPGRLLNKSRVTDAMKDIRDLANAGDFDKAISLLDKVADRNIDYYMIATSLYLTVRDIDKALETVIAARNIEPENQNIAVSLGFIYEYYFHDLPKAVQIYRECLNLPRPHPYAANRLGNIAFQEKDYEKAIDYHKMAVRKFKDSVQSIVDIYTKTDQLEKALEFLRGGSKLRLKDVHIVLYNLLKKLGKKRDAKAALLAAVDAGEEDSNYLLGKHYLTQSRPSLKKAEEQFEAAVEDGDVKGYIGLARISVRQSDMDKAILLYQKAVDKNSAEAAHQLGHIYFKRKDYEKSDEMFSKAVELGDNNSIGCWVQSIFKAQRKDKIQFVLKIMEKHRDDKNIDLLRYDLLYAKLLLWDGQVEKSIDILNTRVGQFMEMKIEKAEVEDYTEQVLSEVVEFFLLLIAMKKYELLEKLFDEKDIFDYKTMMRPIYYLLMEELKDQYPSEYLKAGNELTDTINELKKEVKRLREGL